MARFKKYVIYIGIIVLLMMLLSIFLSHDYQTSLDRTIAVPKNFVYNAVNDLNTQHEWNAKAKFDTSFTFSLPSLTKGRDAFANYTSKTYDDGTIMIMKDSTDYILIHDTASDGDLVKYTYIFQDVDSSQTKLTVKAVGHAGFITNLGNIIHK